MDPRTKTKPAPASKDASLEVQLVFHKKLNSISNKIHSANDTDDILLNLQGEILALFDAQRITIYVIDGSKKQLVSKVMTGSEISEIRVPIDNTSIAGYCASTGEILNIQDVYDVEELKHINPHLRFNRNWDSKTGFRTAQILAAPITSNKYLLGVLQLINKKEGDRFVREDVNFVQEIAAVLGTAFLKNRKMEQGIKATRFDLLITNNIISNANLAAAMSLARKNNKSVESILQTEFDVSKDDIGKSLSVFYGTRFIPYNETMTIPGELLKGLRASYLKNNVFVPVARDDGKIIVVMEDPHYLPAKDAIKRILPGKNFEYCVSLREDIFNMIDMFFEAQVDEILPKQGSIEEILGQLEAGEDQTDEDSERMTEEDNVIVQLVNKIILDAYNRGASDIHIEPRQGKASANIRIRIDGACHVYQTIPYTYKRAIVSRIKIMSDLDISERRLPQDGKIKFGKYAPLDIELRVATIPTAGQNEDVVLRILKTGEPIPLEKMGMSQRNFNVFTDMISKPYGIVLVVGPTGSGKTTTLHSALRHINKPETKIWTAEDPVEITQDGLRQVQVAPRIGFDFATAMRAFLRADPDVIMVGEMRDKETVSTGIEASLTGHLVFSTLHTNSAPETVTRLLDMGMDPFNFSDALLGVLAQRLVRTLCEKCKQKYHPDKTEYDLLARSYDGPMESEFPYSKEFVLYKAKGCPDCGNTGYKGRTAIQELLTGTDKMKLLIMNRANMDELRKQAVKDGMTTLMQDGIRNVCLGLTDLMQVRKVCIR
jgi:type II secretory ATPase GspE/PulE/Tfp pilus assembly ATPase PilB-like protein